MRVSLTADDSAMPPVVPFIIERSDRPVYGVTMHRGRSLSHSFSAASVPSTNWMTFGDAFTGALLNSKRSLCSLAA
jgi:hypothetical protein